ncbi:hypothetical protein D1007_31513 [Hordeum vulgare]|nr:hypothetical protein D1007_31513 [Hordeum vulgare]
MHYTMTIDEARAHYLDMVRQEQFRVVQVGVACNHHLLQEHLLAEEQLVADTAVAPDVDLMEQEALLESYRFARHIRLGR